MVPSIEIVEPRLFDGVVADEVIASLSEAIAERGGCSLVLAGGSTPGGIYRAISRPPRVGEVDWKKVRFYLSDERWVGHDDNLSNFKMIKETLLGNLGCSEVQAYPVNTDAASPEQAAEQYADLIRQHEASGPDGLPQFDVVMLGMGNDGHTASIFPHTGTDANAKRVCYSVQTEAHGRRITLSSNVLFGARKIFFIVKGEEKGEIVKRVIEGAEAVEDLPATAYKRVAGRVTWFLDSGAAVKLSRR